MTTGTLEPRLCIFCRYCDKVSKHSEVAPIFWCRHSASKTISIDNLVVGHVYSWTRCENMRCGACGNTGEYYRAVWPWTRLHRRMVKWGEK